MTDPPDGRDDDRVARLEKQLADTSAQVAQVQAELRDVKGASGPEVPPHEPIIMVGGQQIGNGGPVDLNQILGAEQAEQVRAALGQLSRAGQLSPEVDDRLSGLFGPTPGTTDPPAPPTVDRLSEPPRRVPFAVRLAAFSWSWWELFGILMGLTAPIALRASCRQPSRPASSPPSRRSGSSAAGSTSSVRGC